MNEILNEALEKIVKEERRLRIIENILWVAIALNLGSLFFNLFLR